LVVYGDIKVLKSLDIVSVENDVANTKRITLRFLNPLEANSNYSIISV
jgi:hypothetical protein